MRRMVHVFLTRVFGYDMPIQSITTICAIANQALETQNLVIDSSERRFVSSPLTSCDLCVFHEEQSNSKATTQSYTHQHPETSPSVVRSLTRSSTGADVIRTQGGIDAPV